MAKKTATPGPDPDQDRNELERQCQHMREYRDWAVKALSKMPTARPGSGVNLLPIAERLQNAANDAAAAVEFLTEQLAAMPASAPVSPGERPHHLRYVNMSLIEAIMQFLNAEGRAFSEDEIIAEMSAGGAIIGRKRHVGEIKKSLDTNVRSGTLKQVNRKFGMPDWSAEKFK